MSDNKSITLSDVEAVYRKLQLAPGGSCWLEVDGYRFDSDMGYAFDGIDVYHKLLLQLFDEDFIPACESLKREQ